jgi:hypothetical protein
MLKWGIYNRYVIVTLDLVTSTRRRDEMWNRSVVALVVTVTSMSLLTTTALAVKSGAHRASTHKRSQKTKRPGGDRLKASGGTVQLFPQVKDMQVLRAHGLTVTASAPATGEAAGAVKLPIASGSLDQRTGYGSLTLTGSYTYTESSPPSSASFQDLRVTLGAHSSTLTATVNGQGGGPVFTLRHIVVTHGVSHLKISAALMNTTGIVSLLNGFAEPTTFTPDGQFGWLSVEVPV